MARRRRPALRSLALLAPLFSASLGVCCASAAPPAAGDEDGPTTTATTHQLPAPGAVGGPADALARPHGSVPVDKLLAGPAHRVPGPRRSSLMGPDALGGGGGSSSGADPGAPRPHAPAAAATPVGVVTSAALQAGLAAAAGDVVVVVRQPHQRAARPRPAGPPVLPAMEGRLPAAGAAAAGTGAPRPSAADGGEAAADADPAHHRAPHPWAHGASGNWSAVHAHDPFFDPYGGAAAAWAADAAAGDEDGEDGAFFDAGEDEEDAAFYGDDDEDWEDDAFYDEALDEVDPWAGVPDDDGGVDGDFRGRPPWDEL